MVTTNSDLLIDNVFARIRGLILSNALNAGQKLVDRDLAEQLGVSRTPVREALSRLAMTGLVEKRIRRGYYVKEFSAKEVSDLYDFRKILEVNAVKLAAINAQPKHILEFNRILKALAKLTPDPRDQATAVKLDLEIHELIALASGNESLHQAMQNVLDKVMCFIWVETSTKEALAAAHSQHKKLLNLIKERDAEGAAELISMHVDSAKNSLVKILRARDDLRNAALSATPPMRGFSKTRALKVKSNLI